MTTFNLPALQSNVSHRGAPQIIVVEDDAALQMLLIELLTGEGYQVTALDSGEQALQVLATQMPDLLLLDVCLPDTDGYSICQRIRDTYASAIPIVMLSARRDPRDVLEALHIGANDYVRKPFDADQLLRHVRAHLAVPIIG